MPKMITTNDISLTDLQGLKDTTAEVNVARGGETSLGGRFDAMDDDFEIMLGTGLIGELYPRLTGETDDTLRLNRVFTDAVSKGGGKVKLGAGVEYTFSSSLAIPDVVDFEGQGNNATVTELTYTGTGYAIVTSGSHLRQRLGNFALTLNGSNSGIRIGDIGANLDRDNGILPRQIGLEHITISGIGANQIGILMNNASHVNMKDVRSGYGDGGTGLYITNDSYNAGVAIFDDCTFGRTASSSTNGLDIGLEMDSNTSAGLDTYVFNSCYFGGRLPVRLGKTKVVTGIQFNGMHIEANHIAWGASKVYPVGYIRRPSTPNGHVYKVTTATGAKTSGTVEPTWPTGVGATVTDGDLTWTEVGTDAIYSIELWQTKGVQFNAVTIAGFSSTFVHGINFKDISEGIKVSALVVNEFKGNVYYTDISAANLKNSTLDEASSTGSNTAIAAQWGGSGDYSYAVRNMTGKWKTKYIEVDGFFWTNSNNSKTLAGSAAPTSGSYSKGDVIENVNATLVKNIDRWRCVTTGSPGTWVAYGTGEGTTANRPSLVIGDRGYTYFDTDLNKLVYWNGSAWLG